MTTPILSLEEWESAQAQPEVTINYSVRWLECFAQLIVESQSETDPPDPVDGLRYIVPPGATGAWTGQTALIALAMVDSWQFRSPPEGCLAYVKDEAAEFRCLGGEWVAA